MAVVKGLYTLNHIAECLLDETSDYLEEFSRIFISCYNTGWRFGGKSIHKNIFLTIFPSFIFYLHVFSLIAIGAFTIVTFLFRQASLDITGFGLYFLVVLLLDRLFYITGCNSDFFSQVFSFYSQSL